MSNKKKGSDAFTAPTSASVTFQTSSTMKEMLERVAKELGLTRVADGQERGNTSLIINMMIKFTLDNLPLFTEWVVKRIGSSAKE